MKPIIIQGALYSEINYLIDAIKPKKVEYNNFIFYEGSYNNYPVIISKTKIGEITSSIATSLAIIKYNPLFIINQGTAGACNKNINKEDIVIAEDFYYLSHFSMEKDKETNILNPWKNDGYLSLDNEFISYKTNKDLLNKIKNLKSINNYNVIYGKIGSGDIWTKNNKDIISNNKNYNVLCESMEVAGAYIASNSMNTPVIAIRVISNNELLNQNYDELSSLKSQKLCLEIIDEITKNISK